MKTRIIIILLVFSLFLQAVSAADDCSVRGNVIFTMDKNNFAQGETIVGKITVINNAPIDSTVTYALKLFREKDNYSPWDKPLIQSRTAAPGNNTYNLYQIFRAGIPSDATVGRWYIQLNGAIDNCVYTNVELIGVSSCSDNILNGEEDGVDCGGTCKRCPAPITTTIQQQQQQQSQGDKQTFTNYVVEKVPFQVPKNFIVYLAVGIILFMVVIGASILYWRRRARFSKFY